MIIGSGISRVGKLGAPVTLLAAEALDAALLDAGGLSRAELNGLISMPAIAWPVLMPAHALATRLGFSIPATKPLISQEESNGAWRPFIAKTIDVGGASPISAIAEAERLCETGEANLVSVVCADAAASLPTKTFFQRVIASDTPINEPVIPQAYAALTRAYLDANYAKHGISINEGRHDLAHVSALMLRQASRCPYAVHYQNSSEVRALEHVVEDVVNSKTVSGEDGVISLKECALRADGAAAFIVASDDYLKSVCESKPAVKQRAIQMESFANAASPLAITVTNEDWAIEDDNGGLKRQDQWEMDRWKDLLPHLGVRWAMQAAIERAGICIDNAEDEIDWFALYDCFPVAFAIAAESAGLAKDGCGAKWAKRLAKEKWRNQLSIQVNTHGGLLGCGAPWEAPAGFSLFEAITQLRGEAGARQCPLKVLLNIPQNLSNGTNSADVAKKLVKLS